MSGTDIFNWINLYDGSIGRDGQYVWRELPHAMTRHQAADYCSTRNFCPPERFSEKRPKGIYMQPRRVSAYV